MENTEQDSENETLFSVLKTDIAQSAETDTVKSKRE